MSACAGGKVERVWQDNELGLCVLIDHENGYETLYAGLSSADYVQAGDPVIQGQTMKIRYDMLYNVLKQKEEEPCAALWDISALKTLRPF